MADTTRTSPMDKLASLRSTVWEADLAEMSAWKARAVRLLRMIHAVGRDLADG